MDSALIKQISHRLKGSVGQIGAIRAQTVCAELEAAAKNDAFDEYSKLQQKLETELTLLTPEIDFFLANHDTNSH